MKFSINSLKEDEFGRKDGILLINKPIGVTSHDVVDEYRRKLQIREIGHGGTLDPFASGLLILFVGKATKLAGQFLDFDKEYIADVLLGVSTNSSDPEGVITNTNFEKANEISKEQFQQAVESFKGSYLQYVPVFSSVKIKGDKLRDLARKSEKYEIVEEADKKIVKFYKNNGEIKEITLPQRDLTIYEIELLEFGEKNLSDYQNNITNDFIKRLNELKISSLKVAKVRVKSSKGAYIRQLAEDIGAEIGIPSMLIGLTRTQIGEYTLKDLQSDLS